MDLQGTFLIIQIIQTNEFLINGKRRILFIFNVNINNCGPGYVAVTYCQGSLQMADTEIQSRLTITCTSWFDLNILGILFKRISMCHMKSIPFCYLLFSECASGQK